MDKSSLGRKRKHNELENTAADTSKIQGKLHHGLREIRKAAKKAKTFEIQKLVKKLKASREKGDENPEVVEYETQLSFLKNIDHEVFADTATKTKMMKDRVLCNHQQIQECLTQELGDTPLPTSGHDSSTSKIHSRLLSSKVLATEISSLCSELRGLLGHDSKGSRSKTNDIDTLDVRKADLSLDNPRSQVNTDLDVNSETGWESGTVDEEEKYDRLNRPKSDDGVVEGDSGSGYGSDEWPEPSVNPQADFTKQSGTRSTFLPSLSVGFVRGSDDSDWSDGEAKIADSGTKKNRRGQRARRAIWEKKYGRNANHKKEELNSGHRHRTLKDPGTLKRKSVHHNFVRLENLNRSVKQDSWPRHHEASHSQSGGPHQSHQTASMKANEKPLHPSWEAKRKLKEKQAASMVLGQGTKIKFSD